MIYTDFKLQIVADGDGFQILAESTAGQARGILSLPETASGTAVRGREGPVAAEPRLRHLTLEGREVGGCSAKPTGEDLFRTVFAGDIGRLFDRAHGELDGTADRGLRLRLDLDPRDLRLRRLSHLPWEGLRCPVTRTCLALDRRTPVVRSLDALQTTRVPPLAPPLRVLVAAANPADTCSLKLEEEWRRIVEALQRLKGIEVDLLEHATRKSLRQRIREKAFHIIHFMGHGDFDETSARGSLYLETQEGEADPIWGDSLAALFSGPEKPSLIVLNACNSARATGRPDLDPFAGVALALLLEGVPSVLAMAQPVEDEAAIELAEELYRRIALGDPVEAAVVEARLALRTSARDPECWAIPVHFMRPSAPELPRAPVTVEPRAEAPVPEPPATPATPTMAPVFHSSIQAGQIGKVSHNQATQIWVEGDRLAASE